MNQELINWEEFNSEPIDIMPPTNNDVADYIIMNRQRFALLILLPLLFFYFQLDILAGFSSGLSLLTFISSYHAHKKDEKKINSLINHYWKIRSL